MSAISNFLRRMVLLAALWLTLTGCVQYDTTINFQSFNTGKLVQHITLDQQFYQLNQSALDVWLQSIDHRIRQLHGQVNKVSDRELTVVMPFRTASELVSKFNQFFASDQQLLGSKLTVVQNNLLLATRHQLTYDLDLRSLAVNSPIKLDPLLNSTGLNSAGQTAQPLDLQFALQIPPVMGNQPGRWQLQPGQVNHLSAIFWLPNPIGIGGLIIILVVAIGYLIKGKSAPLSAKL
jgi:Protein of unknown function (DUF3153)